MPRKGFAVFLTVQKTEPPDIDRTGFDDPFAEALAERLTRRHYVAVPAVEAHGWWSLKDLVPVEQLAALARWANEKEAAHKRALRGLYGR